MRNRDIYSKEYKEDIVNRYQQSGLTPYRFCQLPDVTVPPITVKNWVNNHLGIATKRIRKKPSPKNLNIACYSIKDDGKKIDNGEKEVAATLEEMIKFQKDVHNCCLHLYQMSCSKKNISLLSHMMEVL